MTCVRALGRTANNRTRSGCRTKAIDTQVSIRLIRYWVLPSPVRLLWCERNMGIVNTINCASTEMCAAIRAVYVAEGISCSCRMVACEWSRTAVSGADLDARCRRQLRRWGSIEQGVTAFARQVSGDRNVAANAFAQMCQLLVSSHTRRVVSADAGPTDPGKDGFPGDAL